MSEVERIAELEEQGYFESAQQCWRCGVALMVKVVPLKDVDGAIVLSFFHLECPSCGNAWVENG